MQKIGPKIAVITPAHIGSPLPIDPLTSRVKSRYDDTSSLGKGDLQRPRPELFSDQSLTLKPTPYTPTRLKRTTLKHWNGCCYFTVLGQYKTTLAMAVVTHEKGRIKMPRWVICISQAGKGS